MMQFTRRRLPRFSPEDACGSGFDGGVARDQSTFYNLADLHLAANGFAGGRGRAPPKLARRLAVHPGRKVLTIRGTGSPSSEAPYSTGTAGPQRGASICCRDDATCCACRSEPGRPAARAGGDRHPRRLAGVTIFARMTALRHPVGLFQPGGVGEGALSPGILRPVEREDCATGLDGHSCTAEFSPLRPTAMRKLHASVAQPSSPTGADGRMSLAFTRGRDERRGSPPGRGADPAELLIAEGIRIPRTSESSRHTKLACRSTRWNSSSRAACAAGHPGVASQGRRQGDPRAIASA